MRGGIAGKRREWVIVMTALAIFLSINGISWGMETQARGEGRSRQEAINNGLQAALEQALGTLVKSQTQVTNGRLIWDQIASASTGYVRGYDVLSEGQNPATGLYEVELVVRVDDPKIQNAIEECMKDPNFMKLIQETKFDRKRVVVLFVPRTKFDLAYDSKGVQTVLDLVQDRLAAHHFRVFLQDQMRTRNGRMAEKVVDEATAIDLVRQDKGDVAVIVSFDGAVRETGDGYKNILCTLSIKAYDVRTGQFFASVQERGKTISRGGEYGIEDGVARIAIQIGPEAADNITRKIIERLGQQPKFHVLVLQNVSKGDQRAVQEALETIGRRYKVALATGSYMEIEVFTEADSTTVQNTLDRAFMQARLPLDPGGMAGSRIEFGGKAR